MYLLELTYLDRRYYDENVIVFKLAKVGIKSFRLEISEAICWIHPLKTLRPLAFPSGEYQNIYL
jgi:hypothetical protein